MKKTSLIMGMPITVEILDNPTDRIFKKVFEYFTYVDNKFSTYKNTSEISKFNNKKITQSQFTSDMKEIFRLSDQTKKETQGYFDINKNEQYDPSGIVKGWSINNAANIIQKGGYKNFYIDAGGDIQVSGKKWKIGIRNPFKKDEIIKVVYVTSGGVATSGNYERGYHVYNPKNKYSPADDIASITIIGPNIYQADRFATAAFAMGAKGIDFIESLHGFEGYMIDKNSVATMTSGFEKYTAD